MRPCLHFVVFGMLVVGCSSPNLSLLNTHPDGAVTSVDLGPAVEEDSIELDAFVDDTFVPGDTPTTDLSVPTDTPTDTVTVRDAGVDVGTVDMCNMASSNTCTTCTPVDHCGWCTNTNQCLTGTQTGPTNRACTGTQWAWETRDCPAMTTDPCLTHTACTDCANQAACGWCANTRQCLTGTMTGPSNGSCSGANWRPMVTNCGG